MALLAAALLALAALPSPQEQPLEAAWQDHVLPNGTRLSVVHAPLMADQGLFLVLPWGLVRDDAGELQLSHVLEHVLARVADPDADLYTEQGLRVAAETTQGALRLEAYAPPGRWTDAVELMELWLGLREVGPKLLAQEKAEITDEFRRGVPQGRNHKWAAVAWNQAVRHGAGHVRLLGGLGELLPSEVERAAERRLRLGPGAWLLSVGPVEPAEVVEELAAGLGVMGDGRPLALPAAADPDAAREPAHRAITWDISASHYLEAFLLPGEDAVERAAADTLALLVNKRVEQTPSLEQRGFLVSATVDHVTPEGRWFVLSSPVPAGQSVETLRGVYRDLLTSVQGAPETPLALDELRDTVSTWPDFAALRQANAGHPALVDVEARQALFLLYFQVNLDITLPELQAAYAALDRERVDALAKRLFREPNRSSLLIEPRD